MLTRFTLPGRAHGWLIAAIVCFALACFFALGVSMPLPYGETVITETDLLAWWTQPVPVAQLAVAAAQLKGLRSARRMNAAKAGILMVALGLEFLALIMLTVTVAKIV